MDVSAFACSASSAADGSLLSAAVTAVASFSASVELLLPSVFVVSVVAEVFNNGETRPRFDNN